MNLTNPILFTSLLRRALPLAFGLWVACGPAGDESPLQAGDGGEDSSCTEGQTRCSGSEFQTCDDGTFVMAKTCGAACSNSLGCVECDPNAARVCRGDQVHDCNDDGTVGELVQTCGVGQCSAGSCGAASRCDASGVQLIYVVDRDNNFLSFDPEKLGNADPFTMVGRLSCPAGADLFSESETATPFSMSVDRNGTAWVLYSSGEIFHVSTKDASCAPSSWVPRNNGFDLFGMGFVTESEGSDEETLFIAGGGIGQISQGNLGKVNADMTSATIGPFPRTGRADPAGPELTGTGAGELYAYYPGPPYVANLDKNDASKGEQWDLPGKLLPSTPKSWAFAHWGGKFYIFITSDTFILGESSDVLELDPATGNTTAVVEDTGYRIVGAGVSTCAPTQID